ncbi:hypothetical protein GCM10027168_07350 [Streptomyces capparidis]
MPGELVVLEPVVVVLVPLLVPELELELLPNVVLESPPVVPESPPTLLESPPVVKPPELLELLLEPPSSSQPPPSERRAPVRVTSTIANTAMARTWRRVMEWIPRVRTNVIARCTYRTCGCKPARSRKYAD